MLHFYPATVSKGATEDDKTQRMVDVNIITPLRIDIRDKRRTTEQPQMFADLVDSPKEYYCSTRPYFDAFLMKTRVI